MKRSIFIVFIFNFFIVHAQLPLQFTERDQGVAPDYSKESDWLALPFRNDAADIVPRYTKWVSDSLKEVDIFYIYPTIYAKGTTWCADIKDKKLNKKIEKLPVKFQASLFNPYARIYIPRYRQGIIDCFFDTSAAAQDALNFAYKDVKNAFEYYMKNYNQGRPIIIVSHSQGTRHARQLLKEYFDTPEMKKQLVCAYVVGFGIYPNTYKVLTPCNEPTATNCYITWSSFQNKYDAHHDTLLWAKSCINPISWKPDTMAAAARTSILLNINKKKLFYTSVKKQENYLWVKSKMPFMPFFKVMHILDFNLYWGSIQQNVKARIDSYFKQYPK